MKVLFVDACAREDSRTRRLANVLLQKIGAETETVKLYQAELPTMDESAITQRSQDSHAHDFHNPAYGFAKQFANADMIVIAAPYWDLSFPAVLKKYLEAVTVSELTFHYSEKGIPEGLCKAKKLYYVTTAGGPIFNEAFGYGYVQALATYMYGIPECQCFQAENLDVWGSDTEKILLHTVREIEKTSVL